MPIRTLTTLDDCRQAAALEKSVWGYADPEDVMPPAVLLVSGRRGAIVLGAFGDDGEMQGLVYSLPGVKDGRSVQWSHALAVAPAFRGSGIGRRLKLAQRTAAIAQGCELIEWTFDPLQAVNAHFNFAKLGVVVEEYEEDVYGATTSPLHRGAPTDRFLAEWRITTAHVERRIAPDIGLRVRDPGALNAPIVNPSRVAGSALLPGDADLSHEDHRLRVEIPVTTDARAASDPSSPLSWRLATRAVFQHYFRRGYCAVDFLLSRDRGHYLLARQEPKRESGSGAYDGSTSPTGL